MDSDSDAVNDSDTTRPSKKSTDTDSAAVKRSSDGSPRCSCKGMCKIRCPCRKHHAECGENCQCKAARCANRPAAADQTFTVTPPAGGVKKKAGEVTESAADVTFVVPDRKARR